MRRATNKSYEVVWVSKAGRKRRPCPAGHPPDDWWFWDRDMKRCFSSKRKALSFAGGLLRSGIAIPDGITVYDLTGDGTNGYFDRDPANNAWVYSELG